MVIVLHAVRARPTNTQISECTASTDTVCGTCNVPDGGIVTGWDGVNSVCTWDCLHNTYEGLVADGSGAAACIECSACDVDQVQLAACTTNTDTVCGDCSIPPHGVRIGDTCNFECAAGFFLDGTNCSACTTCSVETEIVLGGCLGGGSGDRLCGQCTVPDNATRVVTDDPSTCEYVCLAGFVDNGSGECVECTPAANAFATFNATAQQCESECLPGYFLDDDTSECVLCVIPDNAAFTSQMECTYECVAAFYLLDGACAPCTSCDGGEVVVTPCSATNDTICSTCGSIDNGITSIDQDGTCSYVCNAGYWKDGPSSCQLCSDCPTGELEVTGCNEGSADRTCTTCGSVANAVTVFLDGLTCDWICDDGLYFDTVTSSCVNCTVCQEHEIEASACGKKTDRICTSCGSSTNGGYVSHTSCELVCVSGSYFNGTGCSLCTECAVDGYLAIACTATEDAVCCDVGSFFMEGVLCHVYTLSSKP